MGGTVPLFTMAVSLVVVIASPLCLRPAHAQSVIPDDHQLGHALHHFEVLHKDHLQHSHITNQFRTIHLTTLGRVFKLLLTTKKDPVRDKLKVHVIGKEGERTSFSINSEHFYTGRLAGDSHSSIHAHLNHSEGVLSASIHTSNDHYYIEPSSRHFKQSHDFHMISYKASDLKYNLTDDPSQHFCGARNTDTSHTEHYPGSSFKVSDGTHGTFFGEQEMEESDQQGGGIPSTPNRLRKRQAQFDSSKVLCPLELIATHKFHTAFSTGGSIQNSILFMITVIDSADEQIFRSTQWSDDIVTRGLSIHNITIFTTATAEPQYNSNKTWLSSDLLNTFSQHDWSNVCLAHLFTAEQFTDGRLGVAFIASSNLRSTGGICSTILRNFNGAPITTQNVGLSTLLRGSRSLLLAEATLIVAHELGHNWGSDHDPTAFLNSCNPSLNGGGKFLMFPSASDGNQDNNRKFSDCSRMSIADTIRSKGSICFVENVLDECGNYMVDDMEECDAGFIGKLGNDPCCDSFCKLRPMAICSDVNSVCCSGCRYASNSTTCRLYAPNTNTCLKNVTCSANSATCPLEDTYLDIGTDCQGFGICLPSSTQCNSSGLCGTSPVNSSEPLKCFSLCEQRDMLQCFCPVVSLEEDCRVCCRNKSENSTCLPLVPQVLMPDGSTCVGGSCMGGVCVPVTQDLANRLFSLFTDITIDKFFEFMSENLVASILFWTTVVWVPVSLVVHCVVDRKNWKRFRDEADKQEFLTYLDKREDQYYLSQMDTIAQANPDANIDTHQVKKGIMRQVSLQGSTYDGSYYYDGTYVLSDLPSPGIHGDHRLSDILEESQKLDPELDNIQLFVGARKTSIAKEQGQGTSGERKSDQSSVAKKGHDGSSDTRLLTGQYRAL